MKAILLDSDTPLHSKATVKVFKDGDCIAVYENKDVIEIVPAESVEEVVDSLDHYIWRRIKKMENEEAKKVLMQVMREVQEEYLDESNISD